MMGDFAELAAVTNYSFLHGASSPGDMVMQAMMLGMTGIGIADHNSVAGVVRAHVALKQAREDAAEAGTSLPAFKLIVGSRLIFADATPPIIVYPRNRCGWGQLTRLLSTGNLRAAKGACYLYQADLLNHCRDDWAMIILAAPAMTTDPVLAADLAQLVTRLRSSCPHIWLGVTMARQGPDQRQLAQLTGLAQRLAIPLLATNDPLYASRDQRPLHDILTCIAHKTTIHAAGRLLAANGERFLKPPAEMARLFKACPQAIGETQRLSALIDFTLDQLSYHYPEEPVPAGWTAQDWLAHLSWSAAHQRFGQKLPERLRRKVSEELRLIEKMDYAPYFLTVHDIVKWAREQNILCQGRGSAANSAVCYLLHITAADPMEHDLLFSRFISEERREPPDIDVDFEHERREEVIQYIYQRYGRHRAAIAATVIHYRARSAVREVGKALGLSEDITSRLSSTVWGSHSASSGQSRFAQSGLDPDNPQIRRVGDLVEQILQFPRHLSQHVGGFVLTQDRLDETVPIHNGAMADRTFIEWDKDDINALGLMKVDILALGMLTCIRKSFDLLHTAGIGDFNLQNVPHEDPATYDMLCKGDSIGVFQVESRAQINMLPRLKPRIFYDLVIQVAIVRPGPIEGEMVHPYLRRRAGIEQITLPSPHPPHDPDELQSVLGKTFGVPLFQEQAMKLAIVAAGFSPGDANKLRRAMATFRNVGTIHHFREKMIEGMTAKGYDADFAERCYKQIQGFGSYGFPESHAISFARLVYISSWIKCHHPAIFTTALLNSQPMGFYAPAQLIRDAREHGVQICPPDVNFSGWDNQLEPAAGRLSRPNERRFDLRIGLRQIDGFRQSWAERLIAARPFESIEQLAHAANLPGRALRLLADADCCRSLGLDRRTALWEVRRTPATILPLFAAARANELPQEVDAQLPIMAAGEHIIADYQSLRLSLKGHPMELLRDQMQGIGVLSCAEIAAAENGSQARVAGVVLIRQRPGNGNAVFITLEDESGVCNLLLWASRFEKMRRPVMAARLMVASGAVQRSREGVTHLIVARIEDYSFMLDSISRDRAVSAAGPANARQYPLRVNGGHPRNVRILPKSRDFH